MICTFYHGGLNDHLHTLNANLLYFYDINIITLILEFGYGRVIWGRACSGFVWHGMVSSPPTLFLKPKTILYK